MSLEATSQKQYLNDLQPDFLSVSFAEAFQILNCLIDDAYELASKPNHSHSPSVLDPWEQETIGKLKSLFKNKVPALQFAAAGGDKPTTAMDGEVIVNHRSRALIAIYRDLEQKQERISVAWHSLTSQKELVKSLDAMRMQTDVIRMQTEELWQSLYAKPLLRSDMDRLKSLGMTKNVLLPFLISFAAAWVG